MGGGENTGGHLSEEVGQAFLYVESEDVEDESRCEGSNKIKTSFHIFA